MRKLILALVSLPMVALASPDNPTRQELLQTIEHIQSLAQETQTELDAEKAAHSGIQAALTQAIKSNNDTTEQFVSYQRAAETEIKKGNDAIVKLDIANKKNHRAQWILCGLWIALIGLIITKVPLMVKQYAIYGGIAAIVAGCTFIFLWL